MEQKLTQAEEQVYKRLKRKSLFSGIRIETKQSLKDICGMKFDTLITVGAYRKMLESVSVDFVLYRKDRLLLGVDFLDEPGERALSVGERTLVGNTFRTMNSEYLAIEDSEDPDHAADIIWNHVSGMLKGMK